MVNSRKIEDLDPVPAAVCMYQIRLCHEAGIELLVTSTYRDHEAQDALYAIGRTVELSRKPVTNARAGKSWHNYRNAWDVVPLIGGKAVWDAKDPVWRQVIEFGKKAGAEAGAEWKTFPDLPHFQVRPKRGTAFITLDDAAALWAQDGTLFKGA